MKFLSELFDKHASNKKTIITADELELFDDELILATCILLLEVSKSDDSFDDIEKEKILSILEQNFNLNTQQTNFLFKIADKKNDEMISLYEWTAKINELCSYSDKKKLMKFLWDIAYADGRIDKYEDYTIRKISDLLYVKHSDFIKAKLRSQKEKMMKIGLKEINYYSNQQILEMIKIEHFRNQIIRGLILLVMLLIIIIN